MVPAGFGRQYNNRGDSPLFITVLFISALLHMVAFAAIYLMAELFPGPFIKRPKPEAYVVHLLDPGPVVGSPGTGRSSIVEAVPAPQAPKIKRMQAPEKIPLPLTKGEPENLKKIVVPQKKIDPVKSVAESEKLTTPYKQKQAVAEAKKAESAAKEVRERKGGGNIDVRKFPYEWYLRIMESRIYQNWDTLRVNYYTDRQMRVSVYFQIDRKGNAFDMKVEQSSFNEDIDKSAAEAIRLSSPFPPLPPDYKENTLEVHFGFMLNGSR